MWDWAHKPLFYTSTCIFIIALINSQAFSFFYTFIAPSPNKTKVVSTLSLGNISVSLYFGDVLYT